ncbi:MAG: hypothetical protein K6C94_02115 [Candidatus Gastranaerophilales bacterium]|nr:hypothetical protein [Candidatus Gastranaerophilales bacterium]
MADNDNIIECDGFHIERETITEDDMPNEILKEIYGICGRDVAISLCQYQRGVTINVPAQPWNKIRNRILTEFFDGTTASLRIIARKFGLAEARVREILKEGKIDVPDERQMGLFDNV